MRDSKRINRNNPTGPVLCSYTPCDVTVNSVGKFYRLSCFYDYVMPYVLLSFFPSFLAT